MNTFWLAFEFLINFVEMILSLYLAFGLFADAKANRKKIVTRIILFAFPGAVILLFYPFFLPSAPGLLPAIIIFFLFSTLALHAKPLSALLWSLLNCVLLGFIAFTLDSVLGLLLSSSIQDIDRHSGYRILFLGLSKLLQLLLNECIVRLSSKHRRQSKPIKGSWLQLLFPLLSIACLMNMFNLTDVTDLKTLQLMTIFVCFCLLGLNLFQLVFSAYIRKVNEEKMELTAHNERMKMQMRSHHEINQLYERMRLLKHDLNNQLGTLGTLIKMQEYQKAEDYIAEMIGTFAALTATYCQTGNLALDALISTKAEVADASGIKMKVEARVPPRLNIPDNQLTSLMGNLINNAIDACRKLPAEKKPVIYVEVIYRQKNLCITVKNPTDGKERRSLSQWLTTKQDTFEHGFGLRSIDLIVDQYGGFCSRAHKDHEFTTEIMLPVRVDEKSA